MTCPKCGNENVKRFGYYGRRKIQRYRCRQCRATFNVAPPSPLGTHYTSPEVAARIVAMMMEGVSVRAIARLLDVDKNTILSLLLTIGEKCQTLLDSRIRNVRPRYVQLDETWNFVHTKEKHLNDGDPTEWGDTYTWLALDSETKLMISYLVGKRDAASAHTFIRDFNSRVLGRCQVTSDGFRSYVPAMEEYFGADVDFAQLVKIYGKPDNAGPDWYGSGKVIKTVPTTVTGDPDPKRISTSHVVRVNLTVRMQLRRSTRATNGFSKKLRHLKAAVALFIAWYNFVRVHSSLRVTPAMEAGLSNHIWTVGELIAAT